MFDDRKNKAILTSGAEQARAEALRRMKALSDDAESRGQDGFEAVQAIVDHFRNDERQGIAMLGSLAEVGLIHVLLSDLD